MSDYHNRIMNIATEPGIEELERGDRLLYKYGHQVARHTAAEIAAEAEEEITCLKTENEALRARVAELHLALRIADKQVRLRQQHAPVYTADVQESLRFTKAALSDHGTGAFVLRKQAEAVEEAASCFGGRDFAEVRLGLSEQAQRLRTQATALERQSDGGES